MSNESIQRTALYTGLNLAVSAFYYFGVKERYIPGAVLNKQAAAIGLSVIAQGSRGFFIDHEQRNKDPELLKSLFIHVASITILGIGTYLSGVPLKTTIVATLVLGLTQAQIVDYFIHKDDPPTSSASLTFPHPASTPIAEAGQVLELMNEGSLKESARIKIFLTEAILDRLNGVASVLSKHGNLYEHHPVQHVMLTCGLAEIGERGDLIDLAFETAKTIKDPYLRGACIIRIAYAAKKLAPERSDFKEYLQYCGFNDSIDERRFKPSDQKEMEIERWKAAFEKYNGVDSIPTPISDPGQHHMTRCAYHIQEGNIAEARQATREDVWNLYWRIEALCEIAKREHF